MAPTACESSEVCCSGVEPVPRCALSSRRVARAFTISYITWYPSHQKQGIRDTHMRLCAIVSCSLREVILALRMDQACVTVCYITLYMVVNNVLCTFLMTQLIMGRRICRAIIDIHDCIGFAGFSSKLSFNPSCEKNASRIV